MSYIIAIPSFNRSEIIVNKTLKTLQYGCIPNNIIYIFVADEEEKIKYEKTIPIDIKIIVGKKGICEQRKFIVNFFSEGQKILSIDDDVEGLYEKINDKLEKVNDIDNFFNNAFQVLKVKKLFIFGIYPVCNGYFMKDIITTDLRFIIGTLYGFINRKSEDLLPSSKITEKEDYEQSILYYLKDGGVVRFNGVTVKQKKHSVGGLGKINQRIEANQIASDYLCKTYPQFVKSFTRKNSMREIRLKHYRNRK